MKLARPLQRISLLLLCACATLGTGCSLFPTEDNSSHVITIETEAVYDYELASVTRGDVTKTKNLYCTYSQMEDDELSFATGGLTVRYLYVAVGDAVTAGELLAKLDTASLESQYTSLSYTVDKMTLLKKQAGEMWDFDLAALKTSYENGEIDQDSYKAQKESLDNSYSSQIAGYDDSLYIDELRLDRIKEQLDGSSIYAGMDGTVSEIADSLLDSTSVADQTVITIIDDTNCAFLLTDEEYGEYFAPGDAVTLTDSSGNIYAATVMDSAEGTTYMQPDDPTLNLAVGTRVSLALVIDSVQDVLMLPNSAIHTAGDYTYVYTEDESGLKSIQYITTGVVGSSYTEIKEGLTEGQAVIIE